MMAAMPKSVKIDIEAQNMDKVKTMIELLDRYRGSLPAELVSSLDDLADCEACEYGYKNINKLGFDVGSVEVFCDSQKIENAYSINPILKRVKAYMENRPGMGYELFPEKLILSDGKDIQKRVW